MSRVPLPIDDVLPQVLAALASHANVVLQAPTGSGKTTRLPPALLDAPGHRRGSVLLLEPRRVAARAAARRIAAERGGAVGDEVGYQIRFDQKIGPRTRLKIVTDGVLLRLLQDDPFLEHVQAVVFDEFHERGLNVDLALAMVRRVQQTVRPDLKIVVMSATLDVQRVSQYLGQCPTLVSPGKLFPVEVLYWEEKSQGLNIRGGQNAPGLLPAIRYALEHSPGDVLVFLPGVGEIRRAAADLADLAGEKNFALAPLYGDLPGEQQDAVLQRGSRRKVVLATNVAETSITIDGITSVVDTGLARRSVYDPAVGLDRLVLGKISRASADQRAGRAGRQQPGLCLRLWSERDHQGLELQEEPEIRRVDLAGVCLQLRAWGEADVENFPWFEPPPARALLRGTELLRQLGAVTPANVVPPALTPVGIAMARIPAHPRLARMLLAAREAGILARGALAAALLSERDPFRREFDPAQRGPRRPSHRSESDLLDRVTALEEYEFGGRSPPELGTLNTGAARFLLNARDQFLRILQAAEPRDEQPPQPPAAREQSADAALLRALWTGFPDRLARRRTPGSPRGVMVGGTGVRLDERSAVLEAELFACLDVDAGLGEAVVRLASAVSAEWLPPEQVEVKTVVTFDETAERVVAIRRTAWLDLLLEETPAPLPSGERVAEILAEAARTHWPAVLPQDDESLRNFLHRVRQLKLWMPELGLPAVDDDWLRELLPELCRGCRSFTEMRCAPWLQAVKNRLPYSQQQAIDREAPERVLVPSGNQITLQYLPDRPPILAVRIQEMFGLAETPRIAGGRIPVLLHLLAPNMRPQQVTDDLRSFWDNTYQQVRKDLRRRYPKHAWPEDPWQAEPERRPKPRR